MTAIVVLALGASAIRSVDAHAHLRRVHVRHSDATSCGGRLAVVRAHSGATACIASSAASHFQGFVDALEATGYRIEFMGGWRAHGSCRFCNMHPRGLAIDINQTGRNRITRRFPAGVTALAAHFGLLHGAVWSNPDTGHFELLSQSPTRFAYAGRLGVYSAASSNASARAFADASSGAPSRSPAGAATVASADSSTVASADSSTVVSAGAATVASAGASTVASAGASTVASANASDVTSSVTSAVTSADASSDASASANTGIHHVHRTAALHISHAVAYTDGTALQASGVSPAIRHVHRTAARRVLHAIAYGDGSLLQGSGENLGGRHLRLVVALHASHAVAYVAASALQGSGSGYQ